MCQCIICGGKDNSDHDCEEYYTESILLLEDGSRIENNEENRAKYEKEVRGGSVSCSVCGHAAIDDAWMLNF